MVTLIFESHATSLDNEAGIASGDFDVALSTVGESQAKALGERYRNQEFAAVFCSDLQRSYRTGELAFAGRPFPVLKDKRLRECDYGDFTRRASSEVERCRGNYIEEPFPGGQSYQQTTELMKSFLTDVLSQYNGKTVLVIGSRATQYGLENVINDVPLRKTVTAAWQWQPGWTYKLDAIKN
ncbi:MAG: histidine phosphatase family protein [Patescibacteria group bacterium]